jgi:hypothetical protein
LSEHPDDDIVDPTDAQIGDGTPPDHDLGGGAADPADDRDLGGLGGHLIDPFDRDDASSPAGDRDDLFASHDPFDDGFDDDLDGDGDDGLGDDGDDGDDLDDRADDQLDDAGDDDRGREDLRDVDDPAALESAIHLGQDAGGDDVEGLTHDASGADISIDPDPPPAWADPDLGVFGIDAIGSLAELAGGSAFGVDDVLDDLGLDRGDLDARSSVRILDALGVDARVEHGSIDRLVEHLADGGHVRIASAGRSFDVEEVDDQRDVLVVRGLDGGLRYEVPLEHLDDHWASASYEMIVSPHGEDDVDVAMVSVDLGDVLTPISLDAGR